MIDLPVINIPVLATCKRSNGAVEKHKIKRIKSKETVIGWHWSSINFNSYFTLEVVSWEIIEVC